MSFLRNNSMFSAGAARVLLLGKRESGDILFIKWHRKKSLNFRTSRTMHNLKYVIKNKHRPISFG